MNELQIQAYKRQKELELEKEINKLKQDNLIENNKDIVNYLSSEGFEFFENYTYKKQLNQYIVIYVNLDKNIITFDGDINQQRLNLSEFRSTNDLISFSCLVTLKSELKKIYGLRVIKSNISLEIISFQIDKTYDITQDEKNVLDLFKTFIPDTDYYNCQINTKLNNRILTTASELCSFSELEKK